MHMLFLLSFDFSSHFNQKIGNFCFRYGESVARRNHQMMRVMHVSKEIEEREIEEVGERENLRY